MDKPSWNYSRLASDSEQQENWKMGVIPTLCPINVWLGTYTT